MVLCLYCKSLSSPQASGALRWISGGHLPQKQRRRSKSKTTHFPEEEAKEREVGGEQDKPIPVAWYVGTNLAKLWRSPKNTPENKIRWENCISQIFLPRA